MLALTLWLAFFWGGKRFVGQSQHPSKCPHGLVGTWSSFCVGAVGLLGALGSLGFVSGGRFPTLTAPHGHPRVSPQHRRQVQPPPHFCLIIELVLGWGRGHGGRMVRLWPGLQVAQGGQNAPSALHK